MTKKCGPCGRITWHTEAGECGQCGAVEVSREVSTETKSKKYNFIFDAFRYKSPIITNLYETWSKDNYTQIIRTPIELNPNAFVQKINKDEKTT